MDATVENSTFTLATKAVDKDIQHNVSDISGKANSGEEEQISRNVVLDIEIPPQLEETVSAESSENHSRGTNVAKAAEDKDPESTSNLANISEKCESGGVQVHEEAEQSEIKEEEKIVKENETISDNCSEDGQRVINNDSQQTESENGDSLKVKISEISKYIEVALEDLDDDDGSTRDKQQNNETAIEVSSDHEMIHPQDPPAKVTRIRSGACKSYAAILKKRSIKWLNKSRLQMMRQRNIYGRKIFKELMEGERDIDSGEMFKVQVDVADEKDEEDYNTDNQAKRSRMDDDLEIVVTKKKVCRMVEDENFVNSSRDKVFCDRTNEKDETDDVEMITDVGKSTNSSKIIDIDVNAEEKNSTRIKGKSLQDSSKNQREKPPVHNLGREDMNLPPTKKLCMELEMNFACHDKILSEYIENSSNETVNDIQRHVEQLIVEIQTLNDMIRAKEMEWNNMIHLKKVKEEIVARLTRKRHVLSFSSAKFGSSLDFNALAADDIQKLADETKNLSESAMAKITQAILLNKTNICDDEQQKSVANAPESRNVYHSKRSDGSPASLSGINTTGESGEHRTSEGGFSASQASAFASDLLNGHNARLTQQMGRQGAIKDVKSIIADYRQRHPEIVPRRGRRMKSMLNENSCPKDSGNSRPSSADSSHSNAANSNFAPSSSGPQSASQTGATIGNLSFKDVLVQFAKLSQSDRQIISTASESSTVNAISNSLGKPPPPYPEVTLYPVSSQSNDHIVLNSTNNTHSNSLLHGILTKSTTRPNASGFTSFSPTLARLLTAPERITTPQNASGQFQQQINPALNLSKSHSEITITPVVSQTNFQQSLLQQQQHQRFDNGNSSTMPSVQIRMKQENIFNIDDEADDSADRLVIDEGSDRNIMESSSTKEQQISMVGQEFHENEVPECQGCKKREAQFVCAGCGNQWYCSRECQVSAWDEHSEVCTG